MSGSCRCPNISTCYLCNEPFLSNIVRSSTFSFRVMHAGLEVGAYCGFSASMLSPLPPPPPSCEDVRVPRPLAECRPCVQILR